MHAVLIAVSLAACGIPRATAQGGAIVVALDAPFARRTGDPVTFTPQDVRSRYN
jgi:hypothetical protein